MRTSKSTGLHLVALAVAALAFLAPASARALVPAPDLPEGTFHELHISLANTLTVAQQITQPSICTNGNVCLHDEIRIGVSVNFEEGRIAIDGRAPEDENGNPVLPGAPGAILFNTQAGPAEMSFAPPCENPDGCVGGEALYIGTIDQGGNVFFPSLGMNFQLFGVLPISQFRAPMSTGPTTDPADPGVVAKGTPLDFATGELHLEGIDFIPAPIVGTTLQLNRIRGILDPVPIPPVATKDLLTCQTAIQKAATTFVGVEQTSLSKCVDALLACEVAAETGGPTAGCAAQAQGICDDAEVRIIRAEQALSRKIVRGCGKVGPANMVAIEGGLGLSLFKPQCDELGISTGTREDIALCIGRALACSTEEMVGRLKPRAYEVLASAGYDAFVAPDGCVPDLGAGDASGHSAADLLRCQTAIEKQGAKYGKIKQGELQACLLANLECHLPFELDDPGNLDPECVDEATERCDKALTKIASADTKKLMAIQRACTSLDAADIPALQEGLGFAGIEDLCSSLTPAGDLSSVDGLIDCLSRSLDCSLEGIARSMVPRGHEVLHHHGSEDVVDANPCVHPECGDGLLDVGEECDELFDPDQLCNADCTLVECGDGLQQGTEECDDGNVEDNDGCSSTCEDEPFACGNGVVEFFAGEVCDDSDSAAGDGCNSNCQSNETCGNGFVDTIRGETCDDGGSSFVASLNGSQETPPVVTAATGTGSATLNPDDTLTYSLTTTGLTATMAHIHLGAAGVPGPIAINLAGGPTSWAGTTAPLTAEQKAQFRAGLMYFNVHTAANVSGEIRGQIGFAPTASGDGCSADCRSNETCGNGVIDAVTGEACDDGDILNGDGCDSTCEIEACSFQSQPALGTRVFTIDEVASELRNSIVPGLKLGTVYSDVPFSFSASGTDASGSAMITLDDDVIVTIDIGLGNQTQCLKFEAAGSSGTLNCCGGKAVDMSFTRDSNTGGVPTTGGQANGPAIQLGGIGMGGIGDMLMSFRVRESGGALGTDCTTATYGGPSTRFWTTGTATARVLRPGQGGAVLEFARTGQPFDCAAWTTTDGPGAILSADTALNASGSTDAGNIRRIED
ncbi:MAG: CHRD domain-containing protein [Deltaproteobacteria bacterium]|nr:CHRD domain-containing protein [Deltaproteobacteria bacterium]